MRDSKSRIKLKCIKTKFTARNLRIVTLNCEVSSQYELRNIIMTNSNAFFGLQMNRYTK